MTRSSEESRLAKKYRSTTHYVLSSLVPYTEANIKLSFKPNLFFNDLEKLDRIKASKEALRSAYYRMIKQKLIEIDGNGIPRLTEKGWKRTKKYNPQKLKNAKLMIIFDIPEKEKIKRQRLRLLLRELAFKQIQRSVWMSQFDHREYIRAEIKDLKLEDYIILFEASEIS